MTVWTNEWAGARVLSLFAARAPGRLAVPLLSWEILEEKRAGARGAVASRATAEPATGPRWLSPNAPCFSHPHALPNIAFFFFFLPGKLFLSAFWAKCPFMLQGPALSLGSFM